MNPILELKQKRAALKDKRDGLYALSNATIEKTKTEKRELAAEELTEIETRNASMAELNTEMAVIERKIAAMENAETYRPDPGTGATARREPATAEDNAAKRSFANLGDQVLTVIRSAQTGVIDPRLLEMRAAAGLNESVPSEGGFLVQKDVQTTIMEKIYNVGGLVSRCAKLPISANSNGTKVPGVDESSRADGSRNGGVRGYWVDEAGTITASKPKFYMVELTLSKVAATVYLTGELIQDQSVLNAYLNRVVPQELTFKTEDAIINGDGSGKPLGVLNAGCTVSVAKETGQAAATFTYDNAKKMYSRMWAPSRARAVWFCNQDVEEQFWSMSLAIGTGGAPVFLPGGGASQSPYSTLFGKPIVPIEYCPALGTKGDVVLADLDQYYFIDKGGVQSASSIHVQFLTDQEVLRFIYRVDGQPSWKDPLTPFKGTAASTRSPFVTLDTRA